MEGSSEKPAEPKPKSKRGALIVAIILTVVAIVMIGVLASMLTRPEAVDNSLTVNYTSWSPGTWDSNGDQWRFHYIVSNPAPSIARTCLVICTVLIDGQDSYTNSVVIDMTGLDSSSGYVFVQAPSDFLWVDTDCIVQEM